MLPYNVTAIDGMTYICVQHNCCCRALQYKSSSGIIVAASKKRYRSINPTLCVGGTYDNPKGTNVRSNFALILRKPIQDASIGLILRFRMYCTWVYSIWPLGFVRVGDRRLCQHELSRSAMAAGERLCAMATHKAPQAQAVCDSTDRLISLANEDGARCKAYASGM